MAGYIRYANQGATRNRPLDEDLIKRLQYLEQMGITAHVISGGQPGKDEGGARTGSTRHDHGHSMDADFYIGDRKLDWNNPDDLPIFREIVARGKAAGITGIGGADDYMGAGRLHMGMGAPAVWGAGGKSDNAPTWLREAYNGAPSGKFDPVAEVLAAGPKPETALPSVKPTTPEVPVLQAQAKAPPTAKPEEPKSHNGILVKAYNKLTGSDVQVPGTILGAETDDVMKQFAGLGDFAKAISESDESINNQIQASARSASASRNSAPVELQMIGSYQPISKKKRKGSLSGLGGYLL